MNDLSTYLDSMHSSVQIDLRDKQWHRLGIPCEPGWYYVSTNTPFSLLQKQSLWGLTYIRAKDQKIVKVKNYDLQRRVNRYSDNLSQYFNVKAVYSGFAKSLRARAREHTFADPGTAGLSLSKYPALHEYEWAFHFVTLKRFMVDCQCQEILLRLGEQMWRSKHGWPVLCAEESLAITAADYLRILLNSNVSEYLSRAIAPLQRMPKRYLGLLQPPVSAAADISDQAGRFSAMTATAIDLVTDCNQPETV